jgi:hypothetical protein
LVASLLPCSARMVARQALMVESLVPKVSLRASMVD